MDDQGNRTIVNESRMLTDQLAGFSAACRNGQDAPCTGACPYDLDVRKFLARVRHGNFRGAYNILSEKLLFPATLTALCGHSCRRACEYEMQDACIDLPSIENAVIGSISRKGVRKFRVPPKKDRIAVVGAGLSGLSAAYSLGSLGYPVTVFEKKSAVGGALRSLLSEDIYMAELRSVTEADNVDLILGREICGLNELDGFSGIIIATGASGKRFGLPEKGAGFCFRDHIFMTGEAAGAGITSSVLCGIKAGTAMDRYLKAGEMPRIEKMQPSEEDRVRPAAVRSMDRSAAAAEAERCRMCDCNRCENVCELMRYYKKVPPRFEIDIPGTLNSVGQVRKKSSLRILASCDDCRMCEDVCPEGIRTGDVLMQVRTALAHDRELPPAFHDFWIRDMQFSCSEAAAYLKQPENGYLYFPGCLLGGSDPENVTGSYELLNRILPGCGLFLCCCGIPAKWAGETDLLNQNTDKIRSVWESCGRPVFVTACPSCRRNLKEYLPEIRTQSIYTLLRDHPDQLPEGALRGEKVAVFHPCSSRFDREEQESVKELICSCGGQPFELEVPADRYGCCGYGGHIYYTNRGLYEKITARRAEADSRPYITYCANCRDVLSSKGKDTSHILKILSDGRRDPCPAPSLTERRENRIKLKARLTGVPEPEGTMKLMIQQDVVLKMDRELILNSDIESVIRSSEESGRYIIADNGLCIGHMKLGLVTYWVTWKKEGDTYLILNAYNHRMEIREEQS